MRFEEFVVGHTFVSDARRITREEIIEFARRYDNQPLHVDPDVAKDGLFGDVIGSGYMGLAIAWQLWLSTGAQGSDGRAGVALENAKWLRPMLPGTVVRAEIRVAECWLTSKGHGMIRLAFRLHEDGGSDLLTFETVGIMARAGVALADRLAPRDGS